MKELDLHGVKHEDAQREVVRFIEDNWGKGEAVRIITGHSTKMFGLVHGILCIYEVPFMAGGQIGVDKAMIVVGLDKT